MQSSEQARNLLNEQHKWPCVFAFKFIVPAGKGEELKALLPDCVKLETRPSSGGEYEAFTFHVPVGSADEVLGIYAKVKVVEGLLAL